MPDVDTNIALQLYTVRERTADDLIGTLRELAAAGYRAVEFAGYAGVPIDEIRAALDRFGMRAMAAHVKLEEFDSRFEQVMRELRTLGCEYAVVPWVGEEWRGSVERAHELVATFNRWGADCREAGLHFAYHNHGFEFDPLNGRTMYELLAEETDPSLVDLEFDVFWAKHAGWDPVALLTRYPGRFPLLHVKDMEAGSERRDAPYGEGIIDWSAVFDAAAGGTRWYIVEQDTPRDAMADVTTSLRNLEHALRDRA